MLRISIGMKCDIVLGEACNIDREITVNEAMLEGLVSFRPQRMTSNAAGPGLFYIKHLVVGGVEMVRGDGIDAWQFNANAVGQHLDGTELRLGDRMRVTGQYTGRIPYWDKQTESPRRVVPYEPGEAFTFVLSATGPAAAVGETIL